MNGLDIHLLNGLLISKQFYRDMLCACNGIYIYMYVCMYNQLYFSWVCLFENGNVPAIQWTTIGMLEDILCFFFF